MGYITEERARLMDQYSNLLDRLRELDKIDAEYTRQFTQPAPVQVPTFFQPMRVTAQQTNPNGTITSINNTTIKPMLQDAIENFVQETKQEEVAATAYTGVDLTGITLEQDLFEFEDDIPEAMQIEEYEDEQQEEPFMSVADAIEQLNQQRDLEDENKDSWAYDSEKEVLREKDYSKRAVKVPTKKSSYRDVKVVASGVVSILKEIGRPIKTADLIKRMREADIDTSSPYALLNNVRKYEPRIQKIGFGFYQFQPIATI